MEAFTSKQTLVEVEQKFEKKKIRTPMKIR